MSTFRIADKAHIGYVHLRVPDLERSLAFYRDLLGFKEAHREKKTVFLSAADNVPHQIALTEDSKAKPLQRNLPGLFHIAIRFPNRQELARIFKRVYESQWRFQGFSDHGVSEALYLADADGNGIELYADRPRERWIYNNGQLEMFTQTLDLDNLLKELPQKDITWNGVHSKTDIGHIHLQVSDIAKAEKFYHEVLGFDVTQRNYPGALFVSAGGYHHHVGLNIWNSRGAKATPKDSLGLQRFGIELPDEKSLEQLKKQLTKNSYQFSEEQLATRKSKSVLLHDLDEIEIELFVD